MNSYYLVMLGSGTEKGKRQEGGGGGNGQGTPGGEDMGQEIIKVRE